MDLSESEVNIVDVVFFSRNVVLRVFLESSEKKKNRRKFQVSYPILKGEIGVILKIL